MKKITKKLKGKKVLSFVLAAIMLATTFNVALPMLKLDASAALEYDADGNIMIGGITQKRVVETDGSYARTYAGYASDYLDGCSEPTDIVIPGLDPKDDYVIQGMTYYPKKDWFFVTAYYNKPTFGTAQSSKVFCLDAATGEFVAMFDFYDVGTKTLNTDHGGGIAISEHNIYYSCGDKDRSIAYAPLSALDGITKGEYRTIQLIGEQTFYEVGSVESKSTLTGGVNSAYTAYVCYDQGVLWMGNFYDSLSNDYGKEANEFTDSMVFGYRLSGKNSEEEWANLTSNTQNCQGNPSYAIALSDDSTTGLDIRWVQYATVDSGKLYLSRSASSGDNPLYDNYSHLTVADIDLTTPGTHKIKILTDAAGTTKELTNAYVLSSYHDYPMMPMSEGLCVVDDYLFVTYEGASNKYNSCPKPVDVIWKVDQYALVGAERPDTEELLHYEQVTDLSQIKDNEDYLIVFESAEKNLVTQKPYLYALDSHGGLKGNYLSKHDSGDTDGYDAMIGHKISNYSIEDSLLYLYNPEEDDIPNIRWQISGATNGNLRIKNADTYFTDYCYFYFDKATISMADSSVTDLSSMSFTPAGNGSFYLTNNGSYLWCNDFTVDGYEAAANKWYSDNSGTAMYNGVTETKGTFHTDASSSDNKNILGDSKLASEYLCQFKIFKRTVDPYLSTKESRVYTDMEAELQADGTYTISLDTYATGEIQYQVLEQERPTDFIFVLDSSSSMTDKTDSSGYRRYGDTNTLSAYSIAGNSTKPGDTAATTNSTGSIYIKIGGEFVRLYVDSSKRGDDGKIFDHKYYKYFYIHCNYKGDTLWWVPNDVADPKQGGQWKKTPPAESETMKVYGNKDSDRAKADIFCGEHFEYFATGGKRLDGLQTAVQMLANKLADQVGKTGLDHRIAVVEYGCNSTDTNAWRRTGMFTNDGKFNQYTGAGSIGDSIYKNAFFSYDEAPVFQGATDPRGFQAVADAVWRMASSDDVTNVDTFANYGFDMANQIIANSGKNYLATGDRSLAIITITDGVPGYGSDDPATANKTAELAVQESYKAKCKGANIYTLQMGDNSIDGFSMNLYMDAISSKYPTAKSLTDLGEKNPTDVEYHIDIANGTTEMYNVIADSLFTAIQKNSTFGYTELTDESILREQLSNAFVIPKNADGTLAEGVGISYSLTPGWYDAIDRIYWGEAQTTTAVTGTYDKDRTLLVTGYDYSKNFISHSKTQSNPGYMLTVTITGVLANEAADLTNTSINNDDNTAIYQDDDWLAANYAFKHYPRKYFTIPEYTYVLDYGLDMLDTNVNGTLKSVSKDLSAQRDANGNLAYKTVSENGLVKITNQSQDLLYHTTPTNMNDSGYVLIQRPTEEGEKAKYDWFEIKVVPASNVYFEEDDMVVKEAVNTTPKVAWEDAGKDTNTYRPLTEEGDVVGFDNAYDISNAQYSNGNALTVTVNSTNKNSEIQTFDFVGTGIDIVSRCDYNTGILLVNIKNSAGKSVAASLVDTYCKEGPFNQTPVFSWSVYDDDKEGNDKGTTYGKYTVEVSALYLSTSGALNAKSKSINKSNFIDTGLEMKASESFDTDVLQTMLDEAGVEDVSAKDVDLVWFDDNSIFNGGTGVAPTKKGTRNTKAVTELVNYIDGFRVYNPLGTGESVYTEKNISYANVIDNLAKTTPDTEIADGIAFITGLGSGVNVSFEQYKQAGPKGELYLNAGKAISFKIDRAANEKVMLGLRAVDGATTINVNGYAIDKGINSATEMYYDISNCIKNSGEGVTITVKNTGSNRVAINQIKFSGGSGSNGTVVTPRSLARSADATEATTNKFLPLTQEDLVAIESVMSAEPIPTVVKNGVVIPLVEEEIPEDNTNTDNDNTNEGADTEESENEEFSLFSLIEMLIAFIEKILYNAFGAGSIA